MLTDTQRALLQRNVAVSAGAEVLNLDLTIAADISDDLVGGKVDWNLNATIHRSCTLDLSVELPWGNVLVRPYMILSDGSVEERFDVGVFMLTTPEKPVGESPATFSCQGVDRLYLLQRDVGEDYTILAGTSYRDALVQVLADAGLSGVQIDGAAAVFTLPVDRLWPLVARSTDPDQTNTPVTWLRVVNDLQQAWNGRGVWADENGLFRCQQYQPPSERGPEFTLNADDPRVSILGENRIVTADQWKQPNRWVFLWSNRPGGQQAVEDDGMYTYVLPDSDPMSAASRGLTWTKVYEYEAASQAVLVSLGDRRVADDRRLVTRIKGSTGPFPSAGHADMFGLVDSEIPVSKIQASSWSLDLAGGDTTWEWEAVS